jgi:plasmid stabilization system protein ParE
MKLAFLPAAQEELDAAAVYLDARATGLGAEFVDDVERTAALASTFPNIGQPLDERHRKMTLQRFSYYLAYRVDDASLLVVVAVAHKRRRPGYWRSRT